MNREFAKQWNGYDGNVTVWMLPYKRFGFAEQFRALMESDYSDSNKQFFALLDWVLVDVEIGKDAPTAWKPITHYLKKRKVGDLVHNWGLFQEFGSVTLIEELNIAYEGTREKLLSDTYYNNSDEDATSTNPKA